jgi:hypothetical protein
VTGDVAHREVLVDSSTSARMIAYVEQALGGAFRPIAGGLYDGGHEVRDLKGPPKPPSLGAAPAEPRRASGTGGDWEVAHAVGQRE